MSAFTSQQLKQLQDWLSESGELYVDVHLPHSGGSSTAYFVQSVEDVESLITQQTWPELSVTIFRRLQYPLRGVADDVLLTQALEQMPDGNYFHIVSLDDYYPLSCSWYGCGNSHTELHQEFSEIIGQRVGIGHNPFDTDCSWIYSTPDEVMVIERKREAQLV